MTHPALFYDYDRQAWVKDGVYIRCAHPEHTRCNCYGWRHEGERAPDSASAYLRLEADTPELQAAVKRGAASLRNWARKP